jgi:methyltransferase (TIGR00027 family)
VREGAASATAGWVAALRGLTPLLPRDARLVDDPYGVLFGPKRLARLRETAQSHPNWTAALAGPLLAPLLNGALSLQIRTRAFDDLVLEFLRASGRQLVILGAGFDCRALRLRRQLEGCLVLEVDHPATQVEKRRVLAGAGAPPSPARYVAFDFERDALTELGARLAGEGHDSAVRTLVIWEGVTMYLTDRAIAGTVGAVRALSAPGSVLGFNYVELENLADPTGSERIVRWMAARRGEPFRFGFDPIALPGWLRERGFQLQSDETFDALASRWLPGRYAKISQVAGRRLAIARAT